ncbi:capsular biosynthesis protein [Photobacterium damselae subsp. damselae]|uniref:glycosyltransferase family 2 protein n=1 Tax=Photobacterium damselae TaxID=38293 RepID=UPI000A2FB6F3|nr:glycosyltransferase family 2 protein [Photobacterium damselae]ARR49855.1 capsular biosynthesis protein [Photobacterium damselae subsp. damselae]QAY35599.1 capsular biosynthesis protein [Photobacterium damselae subsp. damselae]
MIVIPMAGLSSRFFKAGFKEPKYMLEAHGITLFDHAIKSFNKYFNSEKFIFIVRNIYNTPGFVKERVESLGISNFEIIVLDKETRGQAETVYIGIKKSKFSKSESITIFNIDTFRPNFSYPDIAKSGDGYLEVFEGTGDNWSFVKAQSIDSLRVIKTTEKKPISNLCCTGLYYFSKVSDFVSVYEQYSEKDPSEWEKGELYVAPLYNIMINNKKEIYYNLIKKNEVIFCGTPDEYENFK